MKLTLNPTFSGCLNLEHIVVCNMYKVSSFLELGFHLGLAIAMINEGSWGEKGNGESAQSLIANSDQEVQDLICKVLGVQV